MLQYPPYSHPAVCKFDPVVLVGAYHPAVLLLKLCVLVLPLWSLDVLYWCMPVQYPPSFPPVLKIDNSVPMKSPHEMLTQVSD